MSPAASLIITRELHLRDRVERAGDPLGQHDPQCGNWRFKSSRPDQTDLIVERSFRGVEPSPEPPAPGYRTLKRASCASTPATIDAAPGVPPTISPPHAHGYPPRPVRNALRRCRSPPSKGACAVPALAGPRLALWPLLSITLAITPERDRPPPHGSMSTRLRDCLVGVRHRVSSVLTLTARES